MVDDDNDSKGNNGTTNNNGNRSPRENGTSGDGSKKDPLSPSSARSTPASSLGKKDGEAKTASAGSPGAGKILPPVSKAALGALGKRISTNTFQTYK